MKNSLTKLNVSSCCFVSFCIHTTLAPSIEPLMFEWKFQLDFFFVCTHIDPFAIKQTFAIPITQCDNQEQPQLTLSRVECRNGNVHRKELQAPSETDMNMNII